MHLKNRKSAKSSITEHILVQLFPKSFLEMSSKDASGKLDSVKLNQ